MLPDTWLLDKSNNLKTGTVEQHHHIVRLCLRLRGETSSEVKQSDSRQPRPESVTRAAQGFGA
jgi:hypothetical protein